MFSRFEKMAIVSIISEQPSYAITTHIEWWILSSKCHIITFGLIFKPGWLLIMEKSGKFDFSSRSGKSQGILQIGQGNFIYQESQGKVREFHNVGPKYVL